MCTATMGHRAPIGVQDDADMRKCIQEVSCKRRLLPALAAFCGARTSVACGTSDAEMIFPGPSSCRHAFRLLQNVDVST